MVLTSEEIQPALQLRRPTVMIFIESVDIATNLLNEGIVSRAASVESDPGNCICFEKMSQSNDIPVSNM